MNINCISQTQEIISKQVIKTPGKTVSERRKKETRELSGERLRIHRANILNFENLYQLTKPKSRFFINKKIIMTEKVQINGKDIWIMIEPHAIHLPGDDAKEYFTATYYSIDPSTNPAGVLFLDTDNKPLSFDSPVEALEYANEKLLDLIK
jgi:hypothetical protein